MLVLQQLVELLIGRQVREQRHRVGILRLRIDQRVDAADRSGDRFQLAFAHPLLLQVDELELHAPLFEVTLRLLRVEALLRSEHLDIHRAPAFRPLVYND